MMPTIPKDNLDPTLMTVYSETIKGKKRGRVTRTTKLPLHPHPNQRSNSLTQDIKGSVQYIDRILLSRNGIELPKLIREMARIYMAYAIFLQMRAFYQLRQGSDESFDDFYERFWTQVNTQETIGGTVPPSRHRRSIRRS
jgi:hypothetical protein